MSTDKFPNPNEVFQDRYRVVSVINRGGFGRVYHAQQTELGRDVAIKVLQPIKRDGMDADQEAKRLKIVAKRFEREAQLVSQLRDSHTVMMYDYGTTDEDLLYMVLEYVDGQPLNEVIEETGPMDPARVVKITRQVLSSLDEAHALSMLHRDVKPQNIMVFEHAGRTDQVKVLDFGLAKSVEGGEFNTEDPDLTGDEVILGTPRYMSPEQIRGEPMGPATDLYSLGLVMYEMLAGYKAVEGESTMNTLARHLNEIPIVLPEEVRVPGALRELIDKMLSKDQTLRPQSAEETLQYLENWHMAKLERAVPRGEMYSTLGHDVDYSVFEAEKRKRAVAIVAAIMVAFLALGGLATLASGPDSEASATETIEAAEPGQAPELDEEDPTEVAEATPPREEEAEVEEAVVDSPPADTRSPAGAVKPEQEPHPVADSEPDPVADPEPEPEPQDEVVAEADPEPEVKVRPKKTAQKKRSTTTSTQRTKPKSGLRLRPVK